MSENLVAEFDSIRAFFKPRMEEKTKILNLKLSDARNDRVRQFFSQYEFCKLWLGNLSVEGWARLAFNCECQTLQEMEEVYVDTEFGSVLFDKELFCFAITADGGFWVVSLKDGHVDLVDGTSSDSENLDVEKSWDSFASFIKDIEDSNLE
jgi:hypothetical protein